MLCTICTLKMVQKSSLEQWTPSVSHGGTYHSGVQAFSLLCAFDLCSACKRRRGCIKENAVTFSKCKTAERELGQQCPRQGWCTTQ